MTYLPRLLRDQVRKGSRPTMIGSPWPQTEHRKRGGSTKPFASLRFGK